MTKILILEQSKSMRNSLRERLDFENYSTEAVDSTEAAAELCNRIAFDVLIAGSGMTLPDRSIPTIIIDSRPTITSASVITTLNSVKTTFLTPENKIISY